MLRMLSALIAYVPVLHRGYTELFLKHNHRGTFFLFLLAPELYPELAHLKKDLRSLPPDWTAKVIRYWNLFPEVTVAGPRELSDLNASQAKIFMPDEDECRIVGEKYLPGRQVIFENIFLRWDRSKSLTEKEVEANCFVSGKEFDRELMGLAEKEATRSPDWWRQIGALLITADKETTLCAFNQPVGNPREHLFSGDPRSNFSRGIAIELSLFIHAEAVLVGEAARKGIALQDGSLYVTTFPCPPCAKLLSRTGLRRLYFSEGYSMLEGEKNLREAGVEIIRVQN